jgi:hypothetical protein
VSRDEAGRDPTHAERSRALEAAQFIARAQDAQEDAQRVQRPRQHRHPDPLHACRGLPQYWIERRDFFQSQKVRVLIPEAKNSESKTQNQKLNQKLNSQTQIKNSNPKLKIKKMLFVFLLIFF